jgi:uncharacterized delta-60 repeat protein
MTSCSRCYRRLTDLKRVRKPWAVQADGKIVVAGHSSQAGTSFDFALARYNSDGSLDTSFDWDGWVTNDHRFRE